MPKNPRIIYHADPYRDLAEQLASTREIVVRAVAVLQAPVPDTFLGRKTQDPFPIEDAK